MLNFLNFNSNSSQTAEDRGPPAVVWCWGAVLRNRQGSSGSHKVVAWIMWEATRLTQSAGGTHTVQKETKHNETYKGKQLTQRHPLNQASSYKSYLSYNHNICVFPFEMHHRKKLYRHPPHRDLSNLHWYPPPAVWPRQLLQAGAELGAPGRVDEVTSGTWASGPTGLWMQHCPENSLQIFSTASLTTWSLNCGSYHIFE